MIILILATDMARHAEILDNFKQTLDNFDYNSEDHLNTLKMILIKACDISNECRPIMVSEGWVECLMEEYFQQSDKEKKDNLPVAPFMDRSTVSTRGGGFRLKDNYISLQGKGDQAHRTSRLHKVCPVTSV